MGDLSGAIVMSGRRHLVHEYMDGWAEVHAMLGRGERERMEDSDCGVSPNPGLVWPGRLQALPCQALHLERGVRSCHKMQCNAMRCDAMR
jgi:hypothetical protein